MRRDQVHGSRGNTTRARFPWLVIFLATLLLGTPALAQMVPDPAAVPAGAPAVTPAAVSDAARIAELQSRIHGTRSARGMVVNDLQRFQTLKLEPVRLTNGEYMLRAYDSATGRFVKVSHPTLKAMVSDIGARRFSTADQAAASGRAHRGWMTRQATELDLRYRGRLGGLQTQLNRAQAGPGVSTTTGANANTGAGTTTAPPGTTTPRASRTTRVSRTATGRNTAPANASTSGTPATATGSTATAVPTGNGPTAPGTTGTGTTATGSGIPSPTTQTGTLRAPAGSQTVVAPTEGTVRPSGTAEAAPTQPAGRMAGVKSALRGSLASLPLIFAASVATTMYDQYRSSGQAELSDALDANLQPGVIGGMLGGVAGGLAGTLAGNAVAGMMGPFGPLVRAFGSIAGAQLGGRAASGAGVDWGRVGFTAGLTSLAAIAVPFLPVIGASAIVSFAAVTVASIVSEKLYDYLFNRNRNRNRPTTTASSAAPAPSGTPATTASAPPPVPAPPATGTRAGSATTAPDGGPSSPPKPRPVVDPNDPYGELIYRTR